MALEYRLTIADDGSATIKKVSEEVSKLKESFEKVDKAGGIFQKGLSKLDQAVAGFGSILMAKGTAMLKDFAVGMVNSYDSAAKLSDNVGVASDSIIGLRHAAELSGVGAEAMDKNLAKLSKSIGEAASGSKQASDLFKKMKIDLKDGNELKSTEQILFAVANKFKELPPGAERATLAMDLFGKSGASMVTMLKDGEAGLKAMSEQGKAAAGDVEGIAESMQKLKDAGTKASAALTGIIATLANDEIFQSAINMVNDLSDSFLKWRAASKDEKEKEKTQNVEDLTEAYKKYQMQLAEVAKAEYSLGVAKDKNLTKTTIDEKQRELSAAQNKLSELNNKSNELEIGANAKKIDQIDVEQAKLQGLVQAYNEIKKEGHSSSQITLSDLKLEIDTTKSYIEQLKTAAATIKTNKQAAANAISGYDDKEDKKKRNNTAANEAAKRYAEEGKRLDEWLAKYEQSKLSENEIAFKAYEEEKKNFDALLEREKISKTEHDVYLIKAYADYEAKEKEIAEKGKEDRIKMEENEQNRILDLRRVLAKNSSEITEIEIEQTKVKYEKALKLAEAAKQDVTLIEKAKQAELDAIQSQSVQNEIARAEEIRSYREIAAQTDNERWVYQMQAINNRYDMEVEKARGNAELIMEIEQARYAEIQRMEEQQSQMRMAMAEQYIGATANVAQAIATYGKAGGKSMQAIAMSTAAINTYVAATKAATATPWPLNIPLVAGAIAQGAVQLAAIKAQKFASGGIVRGGPRLISVNEEGEEGILSTGGLRRLGGAQALNALNGGYNSTVNNNSTSNSNIVINTAVMTQKTWRDEILPVMRTAERRR